MGDVRREKGRRGEGKRGEVFDRVINIPPLFYLEASEALEKFKGHFWLREFPFKLLHTFTLSWNLNLGERNIKYRFLEFHIFKKCLVNFLSSALNMNFRIKNKKLFNKKIGLLTRCSKKKHWNKYWNLPYILV